MICPVCQADTADGLMCGKCTGQLRRALDDLPELLALLADTVRRLDRTSTPGGTRTTSRTIPLPYNPGAVEIRDRVLRGLANLVQELDIGDGAQNLGKNPRAWCRYLGGCVQRIRGHQHAAQIHHDITDSWRTVRAAVDTHPAMMYLGPCPGRLEDGTVCAEQLHADPDADHYQCPRCGTVHNCHNRRRYLRSLLEDQVGTAAECTHVLAMFGQPTTAKTIYNWARPQVDGTVRLSNFGTAGAPRFRVGDVMDIAHAEAEQQRARRRARDELAARRAARAS